MGNRSFADIGISEGHHDLSPLWLIEGLAASIRGRFDFLLAITRRSVAAGRPQEAADVMDVKVLPGDIADQQLFQANAWMLTEALLARPDGPRKLRSFLAELGAQKVASNAFWTIYHQDFAERMALEKWWSIEQARRTAATVAQNLSTEDTVRQLSAILVTKLGPTRGHRGKPEETEASLDKLWQYTDEMWLKDVLKFKIDRLGTLRSQAHPLYQPVLDEYIDAVTWLLRGSIVRFRRNLRNAGVLQAAAEERSRAITTYLDEAERVHEPDELSKVFDGYFQTMAQDQKLEDKRRSPMSDYLDKFDH